MGRIVNLIQELPAVSASVSCMDIGHLAAVIDEVNASDVAFWHSDVVDGRFNQCFILGDLLYPYLREQSGLPVELHLAVEEPELYIDVFSRYELDYVAVHVEAMKKPERIFQKIRALGAQPVLAYRAETAPGDDLIDLAKECAWVLKLTVNPGFSGQSIQPCALEHIRTMRERFAVAGAEIPIQADGNVNTQTVRTLHEVGAKIFTGGTSGLFLKENSVQENIEHLLYAVQQ